MTDMSYSAIPTLARLVDACDKNTSLKLSRWNHQGDIDESLVKGYVLSASSIDDNFSTYFFYSEETKVYLEHRHNSITLYVCGRDYGLIDATIEEFKRAFPKTESNDDATPIEFYFNTPKGPQSVERNLSVPTWESIRSNYPEKVRTQLDYMVKDFKPSHGGQLILFHGNPGTGKTFTIRSIIKEWSKWCTSTVIVDPDDFFGEAQYLMNVILQKREKYDDEGELEQEKWCLIILEDAGEMLSKDARSKVGQGLSRLLNLTEGLIGQGLKILVLISTNEEVSSLHNAISRPGRCAANIEFTNFNAAEANIWRKEHDLPEISKGGSLAVLYAELEDRSHTPVLETVGFGR